METCTCFSGTPSNDTSEIFRTSKELKTKWNFVSRELSSLYAPPIIHSPNAAVSPVILVIFSTNPARMQHFHWHEYAKIELLQNYSNYPTVRRR